MKLLALRMANFRGVTEREIRFGAGVTLLVGPNEVGKSSTADALRMLFDAGLKSHSKRSDVRETQPHGKQLGPQVEAEITAGPYHLLYRKRFLVQPATELEIKAPRAESHSGEEAQRRFHEILAQHVDEALFRALWLPQGQRLRFEAGSAAQAGWLMQALDRAVGGQAVRGDDVELMERAEQERLRYYSPKKGEPANELLAAQRELHARTNEHAALRSAMSELEAALDEHARCEARMLETKQRIPRLKEEADLAAQRFEDAKRRKSELHALQAQARNLTKLADAAREASLQRRQLADRLRKLERECAGAVQAHREAQAEEQVLRRQLQERDLRLQQAQRSLSERQRDAQACRADVDGLRAEAERAAAQAFLEELERRSARCEELRAQARPEYDDQLLAQLDQQLRQRALLEAKLEAAAPQLELEALQAFSLEVNGTARQLADGERIQLSLLRSLVLQLGDLARLNVQFTATDAAARAQLDELETAVLSGFARVGVRDAPGFDTLRQELQAARAKLSIAEERLRAHRDLRLHPSGANDVSAHVRGEISTLARRIEAWRSSRDATRSLPPDLEQAAVAHGRSEEQCAEAQAAKQAAEREQQQAVHALQRVQDRLQSAAQQLERLRADVVRERAALDAARENASDERLADLEQAAAADEKGSLLVVHEWSQQLAIVDVAALEHLARDARLASQRKITELQSAEIEFAKLTTKLETMGASGIGEKCEAAEAALAAAQREHERIERRACAARKLHDVLAQCRRESSEALRKPLQVRIARMGRLVFGADFDVELDEQLNLVSRTWNGLRLEFAQLSFGAQEQLDLLLRLAIAQCVAEDGGIPVLFDDTLGSADPERTRALARLLALPSGDGSSDTLTQVIVFTCHPDRFESLGQVERIDLRPQ